MCSPIPIIVCGQNPRILSAVVAASAPEVEVLHTCGTSASAVAEIPPLLATSTIPPDNDMNMGSKDYARRPTAVVFGGAYGDETVDAVRAAAAEGGVGDVAWLRVDTTKPHPESRAEYGAHIVKRMKDMLVELEGRGELGRDVVYWF